MSGEPMPSPDGPREEGDLGAAEWVASRLTSAQKIALRGLSRLRESDWAYAIDMRATGATLRSLGDFARGKRGILPPLILVRSDYSPEERCYLWQITAFGRRVVAALTKARAQGAAR